MAAEPQKPKSRKKQQIEPLDWSTMSQSPALKGMVSFLEVTPEDVRRQQGRNGDSRTGSDASRGDSSSASASSGYTSGPLVVAVGDSLTVCDSSTVGESSIGLESVALVETKPTVDRLNDTSLAEHLSQGLPVNDSHTPTHSRTADESPTGSESRTGSIKQSVSLSIDRLRQNSPFITGHEEASVDSATGTYDERTPTDARIGIDTHTGSELHTGSDSHIGSDQASNFAGKPIGVSRIGSDSRTGSHQKFSYYVAPDQYLRPQRRMPMLQGEVVWQNRKIRKCILAQDAHSQGEDALFSAMWNAAKCDPADPAGSRTLRIGYAELAQKSRMHRSNIRINIAGLRAKLAIEVLDEHNSRDVMPRLYRLYSYKEILERRRAVGLEYVIRKKSVVFVTETGELVTLPGLPKSGIRKAQQQKSASESEEANYGPSQEVRAEQLDLNVRRISDAMSQHWPVDEAAAQQLLRQCRSVRRDAEIDEIIFFVNEKLQIALINKNIKNPTGLILATVPQCFEGATFQEFRRRRNEGLRLAAEEQERKHRQERELQAWLNRKMQELRALANDASQPPAAREKAHKELKQYGG